MDVCLPVKWQEDGQAFCHVVFEFNNEEIVEHCPVETWHSGKHILSLYYPIEKIVANYTNTFNAVSYTHLDVYKRQGEGKDREYYGCNCLCRLVQGGVSAGCRSGFLAGS